MIEFVFNGMVFILLGLQFPHILGRALIEAHHDSDAQVGLLLGYVAAVLIALYALRFVWVWLLRWFASRGAAKQGVANAVPGVRTRRDDDDRRRARRGDAGGRAVAARHR